MSEVPDSFAGQLLGKMSVDAHALRRLATQTVGAGGPPRGDGPPSRTPHLDKFSRDLTALAREGHLDPVIGRAGRNSARASCAGRFVS
nr:hypothetical protein [Caballeronia sp. Lep1P3]